MRKESIDNRYRFVLGAEATAITAAHTPDGDLPRAEHLDIGITALRRQIELEKQVNSRLGQEFDRLDQRFQSLLSAHNDGMRGLMMTVGQTVREMHVIRRVLIIAGATSSEQAERLYDKALPAINELRATMALWRQREGLEIPEFSLEEEERILNQLIQNPADDRAKAAVTGESQFEPPTEQASPLLATTDRSSTLESPQREVECGNDRD